MPFKFSKFPPLHKISPHKTQLPTLASRLNVVFGLHLVGGARAGLADRGPLKVPREQHVSDERLNRRLAHEPHEEQLLYDR